MVSVLRSFGLNGIDAFPVMVEVDVSTAMPSFDLVGLAGRGGERSEGQGPFCFKKCGVCLSCSEDNGKPCAGRHQEGGVPI